MKVDILAIGVHPDDVELSCAGTLLVHISKGYSAAICDLTKGELGSRGTPELRLKEARKSADILGVEHRVNLGMADGFFQNTRENTMAIIEVIRRFQPEIILANALSDRHPDHGRAAKLVAEAAFYSGLVKIITKDKISSQKQASWRPKALYHYVQDRNTGHDFVVDISEHINTKFAAIEAFSSQFYVEKEEVDGPATPISSKKFMDFLKAKNRFYGRDIGADYAEAFAVNRDIGVKDLFDLL